MGGATPLREVERPPLLDAKCLIRWLEALATIGSTDGGAVSRPAYGAADLRAREWIETQMRGLDMKVHRDAAGNSLGSFGGTVPGLRPISLGSHTDTVPNGGGYDGALGVVAALACVAALRQAGWRLRHSIEVINFAAEEATMAAGTLGSRAMTGLLDRAVLDQPAWDGRKVAEHLTDAGLNPDAIESALREKGCVAAYLELHVEQGSVLDDGKLPIGVVEGIAGIRRYTATFTGRANHAGTTLMEGRQDALVLAAPFVLEVRDVAISEGVVGTVGTARVHPGSANVIPGQVDLSIDLRSVETSRLDRAEQELHLRAKRTGGSLTCLSAKQPVESSPLLVDILCTTCERLELPYARMVSGAGHDAGCMASLTDQAMIFIPSKGGISHSPDEYSEPAACVTGAEVLLASIIALDDALVSAG